MPCEAPAVVLPVGVDDHDETTAKQVDVHVNDAGAAETRQDFGPHVAVMSPVPLDGGRVVLEIDGEHGARYHPPALRSDYFTLQGGE